MKVRLLSVPNTNHHFLLILIEILYSIFDFKVLLASISLPKVYIWTKGIQNWDWEFKWKRGATSYICHNSLKLKFKVPSNAFCSPSKMILSTGALPEYPFLCYSNSLWNWLSCTRRIYCPKISRISVLHLLKHRYLR